MSIIVNLDEYNDSWYEENKSSDYRARYKNSNKRLFYVDEMLKRQKIEFYRFDEMVESAAGIRFNVSSSSLSASDLLIIANIKFVKNKKTFVLDCIEADTFEEGGYGYDGYDETYNYSTYSKLLIYYKEK